MDDLSLYSQINSLSSDMKKKVMDFVSNLKKDQDKSKVITARPFGALKGKIRISDDFDDPLEDFKEYTK